MESGEYPAPFASVYYSMAKLGVEGFSAFPKECLKLCYAFFAAAILINIIRDALGKKRSWFIPLSMAMAIPFFLGSYFAIDMCIGSLIPFIWQKKNNAVANALAPAIASHLICGDGIWALPSSILSLAGLKPPICMKFLSRATNNKVQYLFRILGHTPNSIMKAIKGFYSCNIIKHLSVKLLYVQVWMSMAFFYIF
ncbi:putative metal-nicotianamine transporter YSL5 [Forsythia ovata]|uniref:Metal-nicotianamine transporter YSL5 n=1 Tax=Forsythia ovata TaxID=205694 RepID=A0ABD1QSD9_9LAMI